MTNIMTTLSPIMYVIQEVTSAALRICCIFCLIWYVRNHK